tara:strand:+ start:3036 stop:4670 length:1635 start_codon:yes stop_codon:yes gene_type:complete
MRIFKPYDIRGVYPSEIDEQMAENIGKAIGTIRKGKIGVGRDVRKSSPKLHKAFVKGLISTGAEVIDFGIISTPLIIFATSYYNLSCGAIITASHNPETHNGVKIYDKNSIPLSYETGIAKIEQLTNSKKFRVGKGTIKKTNPFNDYKNYLISKISKPKKLKIVVDCLNGAGSKIIPEILNSWGLNVTKIRCEGNGKFPKDGPNPKAENLKELSKKVKSTNADLGLAFDGDADRLAVVDNNGNFVNVRTVFSLLVKNSALETKNLKVIGDILTSKLVENTVSEVGEFISCRVGHTYISQLFVEKDADLAGELSGHFYFKETYSGDNALFGGMKLIEYLSRTNKQLSDFNFPQYFSYSEYLPINKDRKEFISQLKTELQKEFEIDETDGIKIKFDKGWAVFRLSNTEPKVLVAYESSDRQEFEEIQNLVESKLNPEIQIFSVFDNANGFKITLNKNGQEIGRVFLYLMNNDLHKRPFGLIEDLYVRESHRGQGNGTKLMNSVLKKAKQEKCYKLLCTSRYGRDKLHKMYENLGFKDWGKEFRMDL